MIAYLDNSATTRPWDSVIEAMSACMKEGFYNPSSLYAPAMESEKQLDKCRRVIAQALHAPEGKVIFTSGGTEANNLALIGSISAMHGMRHVAVTAAEHPSVMEAAQALGKMGHRVTILSVDEKGSLKWDEVEALLKDAPPDLVSAMQVNNETGALLDVQRLSSLIKTLSPQTLLHVDGVQGFLRLPMDCRLADMYTLSAHKIMGPKGVGALWVRKGVRLIPRQIGGGQEWQYRSGTQNTPGIAGLLKAMESMPDGAAEKMMGLKMALIEKLQKNIPIEINGPAPAQGAPHIVNISFPGVRGEVMLHALEGEGVYVSTGSACSSKKRKLSPVLLSMGIKEDRAECALRFSLSPCTTMEEIDYACEKADMLYQALKRFRRK